ncbi:DUF3987 domain-containing protein [Thalassoroseus pseudoceratinae]|uniref:DUF3987 domain-containing protein n=1 Tax=Thalassoroseus pseudoceratinae TaxID=2713176 RepID=UPI001420A30A|nr:DUF3987 domain-containing protein [Thalassoroseus pseudoceratinae]
MTDTPITKFLDALDQTIGHKAEPKNDGYLTRCPAHDDHNPSLSIGTGDDGRVLLKCFAGCKVDAICDAVGLTVNDLMPRADSLPPPKKKSTIVATYDYHDEAGELLFQVCRCEPKTFRQRKPDGNGGWDWSVKDVRRVPYRLPGLLAEPTRWVFVVEGEKDADCLAAHGLIATTNAGGAGKDFTEYTGHFSGRNVVILPDNDDPGRSHAEAVARSLNGIAAEVRVVDLPGLPDKGDVSDWFAGDGTVEELQKLVRSASSWEPRETVEEWPSIVSLDKCILPEFPTHVLPDVLRQWVEEEAEATQTPPDLAGMLVMAVVASTIARRVEVEPRPGWREPVNVFIVVVLDPANRKSAVFSDAMRPLEEIEAEMIEDARVSVARAQSERRQLEKRLQAAEKLASTGDSHARHEAGQLAEELAKMPEPQLPCLIIDDATEEVVAQILAEQGGRIASFSPEGGVFDLMAGKYNKNGGTNFTIYLKGHAGENPRSNRVTREAVRIERPALTCAYTIQPAVIQGLADNPAFRGRGLLARFGYAIPRSKIGHRQIAPPPMSDPTREAYRNLIRGLLAIEGENVLRLTGDASAVMVEWEQSIEAMLADDGPLESIKDWGGKLAGATLRLAAVLHCAEHRRPSGRIEKPTILAAIELATYLIPHAEHAFDLMAANDSAAEDDARYILNWIKRHDKKEFTKTDAQQHGKRRFPKADDINSAIETLIHRNYLRQRPTDSSGRGRPPSPTYNVNPQVFHGHSLENRSEYSQKPPANARNGILQNIQHTLPRTR